ncbi:MAG: XRE family transcriptional regulator [Chloroflexi bacterium]|nr:XRE family transcriptional regulator [Chloroflexota bacterium]
MGGKEWHESSLAAKIHLYRVWLGLSMEELAVRAEISTSYLSKIERGGSVPSVDVLERLATGLKTTAARLLSGEPPFGTSPAPELPSAPTPRNLRPIVVRCNQRKIIRPPNSELNYELLTPDLQRQLEFTWVRYPPHYQSPGFNHVGEESLFCLRGSVRVIINGEEFLVNEGDCLSFDPSVPHHVINDTDEEAILISAETPASF